AARGVRGADELDDGLARLLPPAGLLGADDAAVLLADAIGAGSRICVVADYDCDGATACAVALRGLRLLGADPATLSYVVPERRERGAITLAAQPRLGALLDLVALGTVADVVRLDRNNRCLVAHGLKRIRAGRMQPGVAALFAVAGREARQASAADFGFAIGP